MRLDSPPDAEFERNKYCICIVMNILKKYLCCVASLGVNMGRFISKKQRHATATEQKIFNARGF
jgi:hypothetical protein